MKPKVKFQHLSDAMHEWLLESRHTEYHVVYHSCPWCAHDWHAEACKYTGCRCDSARDRCGDVWRPAMTYKLADQIRQICHDTGVDGYTAQACVTEVYVKRPRSDRLKNLVYGRRVVG